MFTLARDYRRNSRQSRRLISGRAREHQRRPISFHSSAHRTWNIEQALFAAEYDRVRAPIAHRRRSVRANVHELCAVCSSCECVRAICRSRSLGGESRDLRELKYMITAALNGCKLVASALRGGDGSGVTRDRRHVRLFTVGSAAMSEYAKEKKI